MSINRILLFVWWIFISAGLNHAFSQTGSGKDKLRLVSADSLVNVSQEGEIIWEIWGNVQLEQGDAFITCRTAKWWEKGERAVLWGNVVIFDEKRTLKADTVYYNGKNQTETATGNVILESGSRRLTSRRMRYSSTEDVAEAWEDVVIWDLIEKVSLEGKYIRYDREADYARMEGEPRLTRIDTTDQSRLVVDAIRMEAWGEQQRVVVSDSVHIQREESEARCSRAVYEAEEDLMILQTDPVIYMTDQIISGDSIRVFWEGKEIDKGVILGNAYVVSRDTLYKDELNGNQIFMEAINDSTREVVITGQANSIYHIFEKDESGVNQFQGDWIRMRFVNQRLTHLEVSSHPDLSQGVYKPLKNNSSPEEKQ